MLKRGESISSTRNNGDIVLNSFKDAKRVVKSLNLVRGSNKGSNGKVLIIGGSYRFVGCLALAAKAAFSVGVDVVTIATIEKAAWVLNTVDPSFITVKLPGKDFSFKHLDVLKQLVLDHDVVLIGNGWSLNNVNRRLLHKLLSLDCRAKFVLDAGALRLINISLLNSKTGSRIVLTPHAKEFESLFNTKLPSDVKERYIIAKRFCGNTVVLLKGVVDVVVDKSNTGLNYSGCDSLTVAGSGDVLAGMVAGLMARGIKRFESSLLAAFINGKAGEILSKHQKYFTAWELANNISSVVKQIGL